MTLVWNYDALGSAYRSDPEARYPHGKYTILGAGRRNATLVLNEQPPQELMVGTVAECMETAEAAEGGPLELEFDPTDLGGGSELDPRTAELVEYALRVGQSGRRLKALAEKGVPGEMYDLEVGILRGYARELGERL